MDLTAAPNSSAPPAERRSHARRKVRSITYIKLGNGNGGILLNIGPGGAALQAVARLNLGQDLALSLKLFDAGETTIQGSAVWLSPTGKEVGICFKNLPGTVEETIWRWMEIEDTGFQPPQPKPVLHPTSIPALREMLRAVESDARFPFRDSLAFAQASPSATPSIELPLQAKVPAPAQPSARSPQDGAAEPGAYLPEASVLDTSVLEAPVPAPIPFPLVRVDAAAIAGNPNPAPAAPVPPTPAPAPTRSFQFFRTIGDLARKQVGHYKVFAAGTRLFEKRIRPAFAIVLERIKERPVATIAVGGIFSIGILALILASARQGRDPIETSSTKAVEADNAVGQTMRAQESAAQPQPQPPRITRRPPEILWQTKLKRFFFWGTEELRHLEPDEVGISVWTDGTSGFYYCVDSPYFEKVLPGTLAQQGDALQEGYQPRLGNYCRE